jgi:transcriptional regulator of acetoin/glycerol metabolism
MTDTTNDALQRAAFMLEVAAKFAKQAADLLPRRAQTVHYDGADCDGHCIADECRAAKADLERVITDSTAATVTGIAARAKARIAGAPATLAQIERAAIVDAMAAEDGNMTATAKRLGIGRATLYRKVKEYGL